VVWNYVTVCLLLEITEILEDQFFKQLSWETVPIYQNEYELVIL
jgi:hypothetical protein